MSEQKSQWVVESFGETTARVEVDGTEVVQLPRSLLPSDAREGEVLTVTRRVRGDEVELSIVRDPGATTAALAASEAQVAEAPVDQSSGDIAL